MEKIFASQNWTHIFWGLFIWALFTIVFFHITKGSGKYIFALFSIVYVVLFIINPLVSFLVALITGLSLIIRQRNLSKSKKKYQKAIAKFEVGGIRRGLTPPEIGAVLGKPFHQIFTLVFIGLLEKRFVVVNDEHNLKLIVSDSMRTRNHSLNVKMRAALRRQGAQELKQVLFPFEEPFLELLEQEDGKRVVEIDFSVTVKPFYQLVSKRIGGDDLDKTREYYIKMVRKFSEGGNSASLSGPRNNREIEWKLLRMYLDDEYTFNVNEHPGWFFDSKDALVKKQSNRVLVEWVNSLEEAINSGLSQEDIKIDLGKMMNENSSEILEEIIHTTHHI